MTAWRIRGGRRGSLVALSAIALASSSDCASSVQPVSESTFTVDAVGDQVQPSLATALDRQGGLWVMAGYTDIAGSRIRSAMGLSIRDPSGAWQVYPSLVPDASEFVPSGDAWLASAQRGSRVYYASLIRRRTTAAAMLDDVGDGLALATIDVANGTPVISAPRRIDLASWPQWDEPTVLATRRPGDPDDTVIVAGTPLGETFQDVLGVLVSHDGGASFHDVHPIFAPGYPGRIPDRPYNTVVRPYLQQDPRAGQECHAFLAFGVYYATALGNTPAVLPPACVFDPLGCRSLAESETFDCGETWSEPQFVVVDTGTPSAEDYRGFCYAIALDGTRVVLYLDESSDNAAVLLKRAAPGRAFSVTASAPGGQRYWADGGLDVVASQRDSGGPHVHRWRPALAAAGTLMAAWLEDDEDSDQSTVRYAMGATSTGGGWSRPRSVDATTDGTSCDRLPEPLDNYMGAVPEAGFGAPAASFLVAWTQFLPCDSTRSRHIVVAHAEP